MFVPDGKSRKDTATLLVGTADEYDIPQRDIKAVRGGFTISDALARVLYDEGVEQTAPKKTSGNRAAKNKKSKED